MAMKPMLWLAAFGAAVSCVLHFAAPFVSKFSAEAWSLAPAGVLWALFAMGLRNNHRWLSWLAFLMALIGVNAALIIMGSWTVIPLWLMQGIIAADATVALSLFFHLWRSKSQREPAEVMAKSNG